LVLIVPLGDNAVGTPASADAAFDIEINNSKDNIGIKYFIVFPLYDYNMLMHCNSSMPLQSKIALKLAIGIRKS
jgi:hypothetical protein